MAKEFLWCKKNLGAEAALTDRARTRWAVLYDMMKALGIDPTAIAVKKYDELFV